MRFRTYRARSLMATLAVAIAATMPAAAEAQRRPAKVGQLPPGTQRPSTEVLLSVGQGELINLPQSVANVWTSNPAVADVFVSNPRQIHLFGKEFGEATVYATTASGTVVYASNVRVSQNLTSIDRMLKLAMPEADIRVVTAGQMAVLTGTVATPDDAAQAKALVTSLLNPGVDVSKPDAQLKVLVVSRLKTATPLQVNLQVKIAEVSREFAKNIGNNLITRDNGTFRIGVSGRDFGGIGNVDTSSLPRLDASARFGLPAGSIELPFDPRIGDFVYPNSGTAFDFSRIRSETARTTLGFAGKLLGLDVASALDLGERDGQVTLLASPNLTALSGETASFLAGGEIPIPISQGIAGGITIEYKQYGVSLAFTPIVLADGRISMRVRPEVSQLTAAGSVVLDGVTIPGLSTRRAETTVELGSGQSFMIGGLLQNSTDNSIDKTPGLGDVPVLGALFRSNAFRRNESELVIVITPYLVKPVNPSDIRLPTDGYKAPTDIERVLLGQTYSGRSGEQRPGPVAAPPSAAPVIGAALPAGPTFAPARAAAAPAGKPAKTAAGAAPGFSF